MQANAARLAFGRRQPSASITFGSRARRFSVARAGQRRDPGPEIDRIRWMSVHCPECWARPGAPLDNSGQL